ncbi:MAG TPA: biotin-dependent carboxyltransferase family protein [Ramlibacter sp.]|uniref:5-oxoprolinase subunit C family protein n=1 Tax=Ramlibacter sp. TaxID=1917967 RepID=UPI002ED30DFD
MIEILGAGALTTVQDRGRYGCLRWGVGTAGAMDGMALAAGNILLGNEEGCAAVEVQIFPFRVRFGADCAFSLTGADCAAQLDGLPLVPWSAHQARAGQELILGTPPAGPARTSRAYLCLPGGVDVPMVLHSRSTQLRGAFGGLGGRALQRGDTLRAGAPAREAAGTGLALVPPELAMPLTKDGVPAVRVLPAAEYERYTPPSRAGFWRTAWKITPQSDRYGYRLAGEALQAIAPLEMRSHGIVPGVIQVPPDGQPIVQMRDAQPTGGYPKLGTVIEADLWRLGQAPIGSRIRFLEASWDEALDALDELQSWLADAARQVDLYRTTRSSA